jgi:hypothetical protein
LVFVGVKMAPKHQVPVEVGVNEGDVAEVVVSLPVAGAVPRLTFVVDGVVVHRAPAELDALQT